MSERDQRRRDDLRRRRRRTRLERLALVVVVAAVAAAAAFVVLRDGGDGGEVPPAEASTEAPTESAASAREADTEPARARPSRVEVAAAGDIAVLGTPPDGGAGLMASVTHLLEGDVVLGNLEGTLATGGASKCGQGEDGSCFAFRTPPALAGHLRSAGFTVMNLANNHSFDYGQQGLDETLAALDDADLLSTGTAGSVATQTVRRAASVRPVEVAVLGFAPYPQTDPLLDIPAARALVERADAQADVVIVTFHGGAEGSGAVHVRPGEETYLGERRGDSIAFSRGVVDAGADLVLGHGPHVMRGMEFYRGRLIAYSLGNFATYRGLSTAGVLALSGVLQITLAGDGRFVSGRLRPAFVTASGAPTPGGAAIEHVRALSRQDFGASAPRIDDAGRIRPPESAQASG